MITTTVEGRKALLIFEQFQIDASLPKHAGKVKTVQGGIVSMGNGAQWMTNTAVTIPIQGSGIFFQQIQPYGSGTGRSGPGWLSRLFSRLFKRVQTVYVDSRKTPVNQVFEAILGKGRKLEVLEGRLEVHKSAIEKARSMGQTALVEQLQERTGMVEMEAVLFAAGYKEFIDEETLIRFAETCEKGLRLDWIKNFVRLIPHNVEITKIKMDALQVFDNYVVLSFDPHNKNTALTKKEIEKKKDPILFGLIRGSRRLYHVGSWKDEYCDLTFGDLIDKYGKEVLTLK